MPWEVRRRGRDHGREDAGGWSRALPVRGDQAEGAGHRGWPWMVRWGGTQAGGGRGRRRSQREGGVRALPVRGDRAGGVGHWAGGALPVEVGTRAGGRGWRQGQHEAGEGDGLKKMNSDLLLFSIGCNRGM